MPESYTGQALRGDFDIWRDAKQRLKEPELAYALGQTHEERHSNRCARCYRK